VSTQTPLNFWNTFRAHYKLLAGTLHFIIARLASMDASAFMAYLLPVSHLATYHPPLLHFPHSIRLRLCETIPTHSQCCKRLWCHPKSSPPIIPYPYPFPFPSSSSNTVLWAFVLVWLPIYSAPPLPFLSGPIPQLKPCATQTHTLFGA